MYFKRRLNSVAWRTLHFVCENIRIYSIKLFRDDRHVEGRFSSSSERIHFLYELIDALRMLRVGTSSIDLSHII